MQGGMADDTTLACALIVGNVFRQRRALIDQQIVKTLLLLRSAE